MSEWLPIESAPRDGKRIVVRGYIERLATGPCNQEYFEVAKFHKEFHRFIGNNGHEIGHAYLTHWMPLPEPPTEQPREITEGRA